MRPHQILSRLVYDLGQSGRDDLQPLKAEPRVAASLNDLLPGVHVLGAGLDVVLRELPQPGVGTCAKRRLGEIERDEIESNSQNLAKLRLLGLLDTLDVSRRRPFMRRLRSATYRSRSALESTPGGKPSDSSFIWAKCE